MADRLMAEVAPPFETTSLRQQLRRFLDRRVSPASASDSVQVRLGSVTWGVYAFYDYDGEPIYVGQTKEKVSTRIRRHLTNQRTDAVAMSVLDPFEVYRVVVWPLHQLQGRKSGDAAAGAILDALERHVYEQAIAASRFGAILNEKLPPEATVNIAKIGVPQSHEGVLVSDQVYAIRRHPDVRIARRASVIARLSQVISERKVTTDLRRVLVVQAQRLHWLSEQRLSALQASAR